ncbi:hypothetical protein QQX98_003766 [Neonectria punicea]|uniref:Uncharacterized protein n=1 Tax=Neonectria punicea TaxID=979145 RepID=A0ABR1HC59_9HYPO
MSTVHNPTYLLVSSWSFPRGGRIAIGNIVRNPLKPQITLTKASLDKPLATTIVREANWQLSLENVNAKRFGIWGALSKSNQANTASRDRTETGLFTATSIDTIYLSEDPSVDEIKARCNDPLVREYMRLNSVLCSPVYMVTGIKVVKGFRSQGDKCVSTGLGADVCTQVTSDTRVGLGAHNSTMSRVMTESASEDEIKPKGWKREKTFLTSEYQPRQAFLADDNVYEEEVDCELSKLYRI